MAAADHLSRLIPEPRNWVRTSVTLPSELWDLLGVNLRAVNASRPSPEKFTRDEFLAECLGWAMRELAKESAEGKMRRAR